MTSLRNSRDPNSGETLPPTLILGVGISRLPVFRIRVADWWNRRWLARFGAQTCTAHVESDVRQPTRHDTRSRKPTRRLARTVLIMLPPPHVRNVSSIPTSRWMEKVRDWYDAFDESYIKQPVNRIITEQYSNDNTNRHVSGAEIAQRA